MLFDRSEAYRYMTLEDRSQGGTEDVAKRLMHRVDLGQVSFLATDLDPQHQFDFNAKMKKRNYKIRLYGPIRSINVRDKPVPADKKDQVKRLSVYVTTQDEGVLKPQLTGFVTPAQVGLDYVSKSTADFQVRVTKIKFPPELAD
jgi:hypothetical protein